MAKRPISPEVKRADIPLSKLPWSIGKLQRRLDELKRVDANEVEDFWVTAETTSNRINDTLAEVFGLNTLEYNRAHQSGGSYTYNVISMDDTPRYKEAQAMAEGIRAAIATLQNEIDMLSEKLADASLPGEDKAAPVPQITTPLNVTEVFVVHGHDDAPKLEVARFIEKAGLRAVILHEQPNRGATVIEKLERHSDVGFAVVLLTPDDIGGQKDGEMKPRARQNVIAELFYFMGRLGRAHVCALLKGNIEIPSDIGGVIYTEFDARGAWKQDLLKELAAAGFNVDWAKAMS